MMLRNNVKNRQPRREQNDRIVFERLWRGTFQAVLSGPQRRVRASSHDPNSNVSLMPSSDASTPSQSSSDVLRDNLEPALRTLLATIRSNCCCHCNCSTTERNDFNENLQVCLSNEEQRKSMRSVIRCASILFMKPFIICTEPYNS